MPSMRTLEETAGKEFEIAFMSQIIEHHAGAIRMSRMTLERARRPEVKQAARKIITAQEKEVRQLTTWLKTWYSAAPDPKLRAQMKADGEPLMEAFRAACQQDCDQAFLTHMAVHHQMGIDMAQPALDKSRHTELRSLARKMIATQADETARFRTWAATHSRS